MFDYKSYVPILRWKQAERFALRDLADDVRTRITPLVQLLPESIAIGKKTPSISHAFRKVAKEMSECWGMRSLLVDLRHINTEVRVGTEHPLAYLARQARGNSVSIVPVIGLHRNAACVQAASQVAAENRNGVCLRLGRTDIANSDLQEEIKSLLMQLSIASNEVDVVLDIGCHDLSYPDFSALPTIIPDICEWRSLAVGSGAFPPDLTQWTTPGIYSTPRRDWQAWLGEVELAENLVRKPSFADYGIYHPTYQPPPWFPNFSASIRYTDEEKWIIMRGEGVRNEGGAGFAQYPANAELLCGMPEFRGASFSAGDAYIAAEAGNYAHPGNASTWLQAGFNHHMTMVVRQIANLFGT